MWTHRFSGRLLALNFPPFEGFDHKRRLAPTPDVNKVGVSQTPVP